MNKRKANWHRYIPFMLNWNHHVVSRGMSIDLVHTDINAMKTQNGTTHCLSVTRTNRGLHYTLSFGEAHQLLQSGKKLLNGGVGGLPSFKIP